MFISLVYELVWVEMKREIPLVFEI
jgi:hypothetical protein